VRHHPAAFLDFYVKVIAASDYLPWR
jgi:hypothetical protein